MTKSARIVVREDGRLILGRNNGLLQAGQCYDLKEYLGVIVITPVGESCVNKDGSHEYLWNRHVGTIVDDGHYIFTNEEFEIRKKKEKTLISTCKLDRGICSNQFGMDIGTGCSTTQECEYKCFNQG